MDGLQVPADHNDGPALNIPRIAADGVRYLLGFALIVTCFYALVVAGGLAAQTPVSRPNPTNLAASDPKALQEQAAVLRDEAAKLQLALDEQRRDADGYRWLLTVIIGLGALYSLSQVVYSYLNLQELKGQAKDALKVVTDLASKTEGDLKTSRGDLKKSAEDDFNQFRTECEAQFPMFAGFEQALGQMSSKLERRFKSAANTGNFYEMLEDYERQEIYYYEKSVASLEFVAISSPGRLFYIFRGFSRFYADKYRKDAVKDPNDLVRAKFYLTRADPASDDFRALNEQGYMAMFTTVPANMTAAEKYFKQSVGIKAEQQCAHYNLARIDHLRAIEQIAVKPTEAKKFFQAATEKLTLAQTCTNWEDTPLPGRATSIDYNLSCGLSRLASLEADTGLKAELLRRSFETLEKAVNAAPEKRSGFAGDRKGDLLELSTDAIYGPKLDVLAAKIHRAGL